MELLARFRERNDRRVYALVRGRDDREVAARVRNTLLSLFGPDHPHRDRVVGADITREPGGERRRSPARGDAATRRS
jgi:hypothetical protein